VGKTLIEREKEIGCPVTSVRIEADKLYPIITNKLTNYLYLSIKSVVV
jgi:hypothetical protein